MYCRRKRMRALSLMFSMCLSRMTISPEVGFSRPASILSIVDLPEPLRPEMQTNSPGLTVRLTPSNAWMCESPTTYSLRTSCSRITGAALFFVSSISHPLLSSPAAWCSSSALPQARISPSRARVSGSTARQAPIKPKTCKPRGSGQRRSSTHTPPRPSAM